MASQSTVTTFGVVCCDDCVLLILQHLAYYQLVVNVGIMCHDCCMIILTAFIVQPICKEFDPQLMELCVVV